MLEIKGHTSGFSIDFGKEQSTKGIGSIYFGYSVKTSFSDFIEVISNIFRSYCIKQSGGVGVVGVFAKGSTGVLLLKL